MVHRRVRDSTPLTRGEEDEHQLDVRSKRNSGATAAIGSDSSGWSTARHELIAVSVATTALAAMSKRPQRSLTFLAIAALGGAGFTYGLGTDQTLLMVAAGAGAMSIYNLLVYPFQESRNNRVRTSVRHAAGGPGKQ